MHISPLRSILCTFFMSAPLVFGADAGLNVWAVNDSVRVDPISNRAFEDNQKLFPDGIRPGYKQSNLIWDGTARRIRLKAARNETVAFQIVIERTGDKLSNVRLTPPQLKGPNGSRIAPENVDLYREWYVHVTTPAKDSYTLGGCQMEESPAPRSFSNKIRNTFTTRSMHFATERIP